jgi:hypothetical protein
MLGEHRSIDAGCVLAATVILLHPYADQLSGNIMPLGKAVKRLAAQKLLCDLTLELYTMGSVSCHGLFSKSPANRSIQLCLPVRHKGSTHVE